MKRLAPLDDATVGPDRRRVFRWLRSLDELRRPGRGPTLSIITHRRAAFVICALALLGEQKHAALGLEWALFATFAGVVYMVGYLKSVRLGGSALSRWHHRALINGVLYLVQLVGAVVLLAGSISGLYVAGAAMVVQLAFLIAGAWLLVVGTRAASAG